MNEYFGKFVKALRDEKNVSQKRLCKGLCTAGMLSQIEKGKKTPNYNIRTRLLERLGMPSQSITHYLQPQEYILWEKKMRILKLVKNEENDRARKILDDWQEQTSSDDIIIQQFIHDMNGILYIRNNEFQMAYGEYKKAKDLTMRDISIQTISSYELAPIEYYYYMMEIFCGYKVDNKFDAMVSAYACLLDNIEETNFTPDVKATVLPIITSYYCDAILQNKSNTRDALCWLNSSLELLRETHTGYYLVKLLETKIKIIGENDAESEAISEVIDLLKELYRKCGVDPDRIHTGFLYEGIVCQNIGDVISERRKLFGYSQKKLAEGICSTKTLGRIERGEVAAQEYVLSRILNKLNLSDAYMFDEVIAYKGKTIEAAKKYRASILNSQINRQGLYLEELENSIDNQIKQNSQILLLYKAMYLLNLKKIEESQYNMFITEALSKTLPDIVSWAEGSGYFTNGELDCIYSLAAISHLWKDRTNEHKFRRFFEKIIESDYPIKPFCKISILRWLLISYMIEGDYFTSKQLAWKAIKYSLTVSKIRMLSILVLDMLEAEAEGENIPFLLTKGSITSKLFSLASCTGNTSAAKYILEEAGKSE